MLSLPLSELHVPVSELYQQQSATSERFSNTNIARTSFRFITSTVTLMMAAAQGNGVLSRKVPVTSRIVTAALNVASSISDFLNLDDMALADWSARDRLCGGTGL